jgi:hypothetical protein
MGALVDRICVDRRSLERLAFDERPEKLVGELQVVVGICNSRSLRG